MNKIIIPLWTANIRETGGLTFEIVVYMNEPLVITRDGYWFFIPLTKGERLAMNEPSTLWTDHNMDVEP